MEHEGSEVSPATAGERAAHVLLMGTRTPVLRPIDRSCRGRVPGLGWGLIFPVGITIAWLRDRVSTNWAAWHLRLQMAGYVVAAGQCLRYEWAVCFLQGVDGDGRIYRGVHAGWVGRLERPSYTTRVGHHGFALHSPVVRCLSSRTRWPQQIVLSPFMGNWSPMDRAGHPLARNRSILYWILNALCHPRTVFIFAFLSSTA